MLSGYKVDFLRPTRFQEGSEGRISPEASKADRKGMGVRGPNFKQAIKADNCIGNFFL